VSSVLQVFLNGIISDLGVSGDLDVLDELLDIYQMARSADLVWQAPNALRTARRYWPEHFTLMFRSSSVQLELHSSTCAPFCHEACSAIAR